MGHVLGFSFNGHDKCLSAFTSDVAHILNNPQVPIIHMSIFLCSSFDSAQFFLIYFFFDKC